MLALPYPPPMADPNSPLLRFRLWRAALPPALRDEIDRFESAWDDKRDTLKDDVKTVQESVEGVARAWADFDSEAATSLDSTTRTPQVQKPE